MMYRLLIGLVASVAVVAGWARGWAIVIVAVGSAEIVDMLDASRS